MLSRDDIVARGPAGPAVNAAIYDKWFAPPPTRLLAYAMRAYRLDRLSVADVGSSYGHALRHFGPGSYGVEINPEAAAWATAVGLTTCTGDIETIAAPPVDAVWARDVIEHVDSPHLALRGMARLLKADGLAFVVAPLIGPGRLLGPLSARFRGFEAKDHVSFFTAGTLRWTVKRAGFDIVEITIGKHRWLDRLAVTLTPQCLVVARKIADWDYDAKSARCLDGGRTARKDKALRAIGYD
ncbi:class I SAM-dependent methyltransferase [Parablastomonas sp. CN1-191]|uniref:class I SAM-dependent methyltransferase n=1 Tax=Parablastomonas sp. CN1-191 TaxID=3400908 RepID=UPI003BF8C9A2